MRTRATFRSRASSRKLARRAATLSILSVAAALVVTNLTPVVVTSASWTGDEWDHGKVSTLSCADDGSDFKTRGAGRLLGGALLASDLDTLAAVGGMTVTNDGNRANPNPEKASTTGAYANPLDVTALGSVNLSLTDSTLDDFLSLPFASDFGAVNQYARADDDGNSQGASGVLNDSGFVDTDDFEAGALPTLGTLKLSTLLQELLGEAASEVLTGITDLQLEVGAVASHATLDACTTAWTDDIDGNLERKYAIAGLDATVATPLVGDLTSTLRGALTPAIAGLQNQLTNLAGQSGVLSGITGAVGDLLTGVLGDILLRTNLDALSIDVDLMAAVEPLLGTTIQDDASTVSIDLTKGQVRVDLAALLGAAYTGERFDGAPEDGLNGLSPNTELVLNTDVTKALIAALGNALDGWVADVQAEIARAILAAEVHVSISVELRALVLKLAGVSLTIDGTLQDLLNGDAVVDPTVKILVGCSILNPLACLVDDIVEALVGGIGESVGNVLKKVILDDGALVSTLGSTLAVTLATAIDPLSNTLEALFIELNGLISLRANVQNDPAAGNTPDPDPVLTYPDWEDGSVPEGRYDVAALSIAILNAAGTTGNVNLELARSSVGVSCAVGGVWDLAERCFAY